MISYAGLRNGFPFPIYEKGTNGLTFEEWDGITGYPDWPPNHAGNPDSVSGKFVYGPGTYRPIGLTLAQLAELYWRGKTAYLDYGITVFDEDGLEIPVLGSTECYLYRAKAGALDTAIAKEIQLISDPAPGYFYDDPTTDYVYLTIGFAKRGANASGETYGEDGVWKIDDLYYPLIKGSLGYCHTWVGDGHESSGRVGKSAGLSLDFFGYGGIPLYLTNAPAAYPDPTTATGSASVAYTSYYPYDGKWNTSDGTPL
jgi:hypothetical protein